jgi:hypothetical protein
MQEEWSLPDVKFFRYNGHDWVRILLSQVEEQGTSAAILFSEMVRMVLSNLQYFKIYKFYNDWYF